MRSISMTAWRRPEYTRQVLESLWPCLESSPRWRIFISVDAPQHPEVDTVIGQQQKAVQEVFDRELPLLCDGSHIPRLYIQRKRLGIDENTRFAVQWAFDRGSDFNLHIEDDTVLSPDALDICDWFYYELENREDYACLLLHSLSYDTTHPREMVEYFGFSSWGWAVSRRMWEKWFKPEWNAKRHLHPKGWDWSMGLTIQRHGLKCLHPVLSRVRNIGRQDGQYETPEHWDKWVPKLVQSPGGYGKGFWISERLPEGYETYPQVWVLDELAAERQATPNAI